MPMVPSSVGLSMRSFCASLALLLAIIPRVRADLAADVKQAIEKGIAGLRTMQQNDGSWGQYGVGSTATAMLALLETGVASNDPAIVKAASYIRHQGLRSEHTYSVSLTILTLDRLAVKEDFALIRLLTERMVKDQKEDGGWTYKL